MSKSILRLMVTLLFAIGLTVGTVATVGAQSTSVTQDNDNDNDQNSDNQNNQNHDQDSDQETNSLNDLSVGDAGQSCDEGTEGGGDRADAVICTTGNSSSFIGDTNQSSTRANTSNQGQNQVNEIGQNNVNVTNQRNPADISDEVDGDDNVVGSGAIVGMLIAVLASVIGASIE